MSIPVVLAASEPWEKEVFKKSNFEFETIYVQFNDIDISGKTPEEFAGNVARRKLQCALEKKKHNSSNEIIFATHKILMQCGQICRQVQTRKEAKDKLHYCHNTPLQCITAVAMKHSNKQEIIEELLSCTMEIKKFTIDEINTLLDYDEIFNFAGALPIGLHNNFSDLVEGHISMKTGDIHTASGMPLELIGKMSEKLGNRI